MNGETLSAGSPSLPRVEQALVVQKYIDEQIEMQHKDLYDIINRLDRIADRLNSKDYSKNNPQINEKDGCSTGVEKGEDPGQKPDGLLGHIMQINERHQERIGDFRRNILPGLLIAVEYIEINV